MILNKKNITRIDLLKLKRRSLIYQFILKNPGLHFRELVRRLNIPRSTLSYYLSYLVKQELLIVKKDDKYKRYFISKNLGDSEKKILSILRVETTRNVLLCLMIFVSASQIKLAEELEKHPTTINFHLKRILKHGIIEPAPIENGVIYTKSINIPIIYRKKSKNEIFYRLKEPELIEKLLIIYYEKGYYDDKIAKTIFSYPEYAIPRGRSKVLKTTKETVEIIENFVLDVFPHPYHA